MTEEPRFTIGSGNVFADLGFPNPEEALEKSKLADAIYKAVTPCILSCQETAEALGLTRLELTCIAQGRLSRFTVEKLEKVLMLAEKLPRKG
jgi:predicted XRE-type DNA-binding protein